MKKTKSLEIFLNDFKEIYEAILNISLLGYINSAVHLNANDDLYKIEENEAYLRVKNFSIKNNLYNFLLVNLISITESYLQNVLIEILEKHPERVNDFILKYKIDRTILPQDLIDGPLKFTISILNNVIYHNLRKVNLLFKIIADIDILKEEMTNVKELFKIIDLRHKFVHKSSKIENKKIYLKELTMLNIMNLINHWLITIDNEITGSKTRKLDVLTKFYKEITKIRSSPVLEKGVRQHSSIIISEVFETPPNNIINI